MQELTHARAGQISGGVFLIGLGLMLFGILPWFPGILYVLGATALVNGFVPGPSRSGALTGAAVLFGLGLMFTVGWWLLPLVVIIIGIRLLMGKGTGFPFTKGEQGEQGEDRGERAAYREQRRALKEQYRAEARALKDQFQYGDHYVPPHKMKNDQLGDAPDASETPDEEYTLGADGELIKAKNDQRRSGSRGNSSGQ